MTQINEWDPVWSVGQDGSTPSKKLIAAICASLSRLAPAPRAVHFYRGEGLRWIRVGFGEEGILGPAQVAAVGGCIAKSVGDKEPLYFHALRPRDLLFFLEGGEGHKQDAVGMPPGYFGLPLTEVLRAWG